MQTRQADASSRVLSAALCGGVVLVAVWAFAAGRFRFGIAPVCVLHRVTGLYCPGCGAWRATQALLRGDVAAAFASNPLFVVALPFLAAWLTGHAWRAVTGREWAAIRISTRCGYAILAIVALYVLVRNVPHPVFDPLRPPEREETRILHEDG